VTTPDRKLLTQPMNGPPHEAPIGLLAAQVGRAVDHAFDDALAAVGGSRPTWLILLAIISGAGTTQSALADRVGISGPTLVHHLDRLERANLVVRQVDPTNRRIRVLALTADGRAAFFGMREAAVTFDARLRDGISDRELATLRRLLTRVRSNLTPSRSDQHDRTQPANSGSTPADDAPGKCADASSSGVTVPNPIG
jgi:MarR family transcriptional regulator for hemolysin